MKTTNNITNNKKTKLESYCRHNTGKTSQRYVKIQNFTQAHMIADDFYSFVYKASTLTQNSIMK